MNFYAQTAILATKLIHDRGLSPQNAWIDASHIVFPDSHSSRVKGCPKNAFLGLCQEGLIRGVPVDSYTKSKANARYAVKAVEFLRENKGVSITPKELWDIVAGPDKKYNSQMDVVLELVKEGYIKI